MWHFPVRWASLQWRLANAFDGSAAATIGGMSDRGSMSDSGHTRSLFTGLCESAHPAPELVASEGHGVLLTN